MNESMYGSYSRWGFSSQRTVCLPEGSCDSYFASLVIYGCAFCFKKLEVGDLYDQIDPQIPVLPQPF